MPFEAHDQGKTMAGAIKGAYQIYPDKVVVQIKDTQLSFPAELAQEPDEKWELQAFFITIESPENPEGIEVHRRLLKGTLRPGETFELPDMSFTFERTTLPDDELVKGRLRFSVARTDGSFAFVTPKDETFRLAP